MPAKPTRAISIRQPYVEQILRGIKIREYRTKPTKIRERVFLYASLHRSDWFNYDLLGWEPEKLPHGLLVGSVEIAGCEWFSKGNCWAYELANPRRLRVQLKSEKQPQPIWFYPLQGLRVGTTRRSSSRRLQGRLDD